MRRALTLLTPTYTKALAYMLQSTDYDISQYLSWLSRLPNFQTIMNRGSLKDTRASVAIRTYLNIVYIAFLIVGLLIAYKISGVAGVLLIAIMPIILPLSIIPPLLVTQILQKHIASKRTDKKTELMFRDHPATKIAILGSYGKTTVKELLLEVLGSEYKVAATPGNMNTSIAHHRFGQRLKGDEDFLIIEYGEEAPGDIVRYAKNTHPDIAIITGLAPAHMNKLKSIDGAGHELFSIVDFVDSKNIYVNQESPMLTEYSHKFHGKKSLKYFSENKTLGWKTSNIKIGLDGLNFDLKKESRKIHIESKLIGEHLVGSLALVASLSCQLGMKETSIEKAVLKTKAHHARLEPKKVGGSTIINDGYNGNIEGIKAGIKLIKSVQVKGKKIYVTPGLVHQGTHTKEVHKEIAHLISGVFDKVYLIDNPQTKIIRDELQQTSPKLSPVMVPDALKFYQDIQSFLAAGDVVLIQNDLPDSLA